MGEEEHMRRNTIMVMAIGLSAFALPALALPPPPDTVLIHGFDDENNVLVFGTSEVDASAAGCDLPKGTYGYQVDDEGTASLVEDDSNPGPETLDADPGESGEDDPCGIQVVDVTGPNGQVNHGQVVSSFMHALGELGLRGRGCVARVIAQSDHGKGDQQIRTSDVEEPNGDAPAFEGGMVDLDPVFATCSPSEKHSVDDSERGNNGNGQGKGRPENPGNSGDHGNGNKGNSNKGNNGRGNGQP